MSRVLALVVAVAMVVGALWLRGRLDGQESAGDGNPRASGEAPATDGEEPLVLVCAAELFHACEGLAAAQSGLEIQIEPVGETAAALTAATADPEFDLWLVPAPWPEVVAIQRDAQAPQAGPLPWETSAPLARSPLVLVGFVERLQALDASCGRPVDWACLGERAGTPWRDLGLAGATGSVRPGHPDPVTSASGLLVLGSAVVSWAGRTDVSRADLDSDAFSAWFTRLEEAVPGFTPTQLTDMLTRGLASFDVIGTTEADAVPALAEAAAPPAPIAVRYPEPLATADVVLVALPSAGGLDTVLGELGDDFETVLADTGWRVDGAAADGPALPEDAGLPSAGLLVALQQRWREVTS